MKPLEIKSPVGGSAYERSGTTVEKLARAKVVRRRQKRKVLTK